jgi:peptidoglycan/xylan/chitin deacetylase (PgdA/CDA1 family)
MIIAYHEFSETPVRDVYAITRETFWRHAQLAAESGGMIDRITFDDAHHSQFSIAAPVLNQLRISGIFFATTAWIGCYPGVMSGKELRALHEAGHTIGSHTHTHPMLTACGERSLQNELEVSKQLLEDMIGDEVNCISIPSGRVDTRVLAACRAAGYKRVYTSRVGEYGAPTDEFPEVIGRFVVRRSTPEQTLRNYLAGDAATCRRLRLASETRQFAKMIVGDVLYQRVWRYAVRSRLYSN